MTGFAEHPRFVGPRILDTCNRRQRTLGIYYYLKLRILTTNRATTLTGCRPIECSTTVFAVLSDRSASDKLAITTCGLMSPIIPDPPPGSGFFETVDLQSILNIHVCRYIISPTDRRRFHWKYSHPERNSDRDTGPTLLAESRHSRNFGHLRAGHEKSTKDF